MRSFFTYLPEEVIEIIFSKLPADSVLRFKCVNKSWYAFISALIKDPGFVTKNLHNAKNNSSLSLIFNTYYPDIYGICRGLEYPGEPKISSVSLLNDVSEHDPINSVTKDLGLTLSQDGECRESDWRLVCQCDGILCLDKGRLVQNLLLCNPALHEFKLIPEPVRPKKFINVGLGFGFDFRANKYKLVRIIYQKRKFEAEVHTLGSNSWRKIDLCCETLSLYEYGYMYWEGLCFWILTTREGGILCFDMADEVFHIIPLPIKSDNCAFLAVQDDSLVLFVRPLNRIGENLGSRSLEMWVMDGYFDKVKGVKSAWRLVKRLVIEPLARIRFPLKFWKSDELLLFDRSEGRVHSYNLQTRKLRNIVGVDRFGAVIPICFFYFKSLVSIKGSELEAESSRKLKEVRKTSS